MAKLARYPGYRPDEIVYEKEDFQSKRFIRIFQSVLILILSVRPSGRNLLPVDFNAILDYNATDI